MQLSERWLRAWVNPAVTATELAHKLNMAGLEAEAEPLHAHPLTGVVVGRIVSAEKHPQADRLQVCQVDVGGDTLRQIVCGAPNARPGLCVPCALPGASLPGGVEIKDAALRGVASAGMLCSAKELAISDKSEGLLELDDHALIGQPIHDYLGLADHLITLELTPNRGDALSIAGLARETGALYGLSVTQPVIDAVLPLSDSRLALAVQNPNDCPAYTGRVITGINPAARTPDWMRERLRRSGIRCIHPVVDITNYVMLELGQPLHAFDLANISGSITVRRAQPGETLKLLTGDTAVLSSELLITDANGPLAMAGVMGGGDSGCTANTTRIFFEAAAFAPAAITGTARRHKLSSDASYRFERGVDFALHAQALERATALTLQICGGQPGPVCRADTPALPAAPSIVLSHSRIEALLGTPVPAATVAPLLASLGVSTSAQGEGQWLCKPPSWRFDLTIQQDLIEELARLIGYDSIVARPYHAALIPAANTELRRSPARIKDLLAARGWQEAITYSFVDVGLLALLNPNAPALVLDNPIAATMSSMRTTLWAGLVQACQYNQQRQQARVRLFELASTFAEVEGQIVETPRLAGLAWGAAQPEQWASPARPVDFYDVKADVEALLQAFGGQAFAWSAGQHPSLHPGRTAHISRNGQSVGWLGELHPSLVAKLDLPSAPILFELDYRQAGAAQLPVVAATGEFPTSRRDLALLVDGQVPIAELTATIRAAGGPLLKEVRLFDIYRGKGLESTSKSVAFGLIFQDLSRTLTVEEIDQVVAAVLAQLAAQHGASQR